MLQNVKKYILIYVYNHKLKIISHGKNIIDNFEEKTIFLALSTN